MSGAGCGRGGPEPRAEQGGSRERCWAWGCGTEDAEAHRKQGANCCSQNNLLFFLNLPHSAEAAQKEVSTSVSATKQLLTALEPPLHPFQLPPEKLFLLSAPQISSFCCSATAKLCIELLIKPKPPLFWFRIFLVCGFVILFF